MPEAFSNRIDPLISAAVLAIVVANMRHVNYHVVPKALPEHYFKHPQHRLEGIAHSFMTTVDDKNESVDVDFSF